MSANLNGKVAFITGAARGQGRSHAIKMAECGADIIAVDICSQIGAVAYSLADSDDLAVTVNEVEARGQRIFAAEVDVRCQSELLAAVSDGVRALGRLDIVVANAGIAPFNVNPREGEWDAVIGVNLTGVYNTIVAALPALTEHGEGGSIVLTGSTAALNGVGANTPGGLAYTASKHGLVGLMRAYANYLASQSIRVNAVHPTGVRTDMITSDAMREFFEANPDSGRSATVNALPIDMLEAEDIANAVAWLVSDDARFVTGINLPVDAGFTNRK